MLPQTVVPVSAVLRLFSSTLEVCVGGRHTPLLPKIHVHCLLPHNPLLASSMNPAWGIWCILTVKEYWWDYDLPE